MIAQVQLAFPGPPIRTNRRICELVFTFVSPRNVPQQDRSRAMVDRILDAAATVLAEDGYQRASTNRIAREAEVSPGSLYRYFDDKDAIVTALSHRLVGDFAAELTPALRAALGQPAVTATHTVTTAVLDALERHASLLRAIVDRVPAAEQAVVLEGVQQRVFDVTYQLVAIHGDATDPQRLEQATWMIVQSTRHLAVRYVLDAPGFPRDALVDGIARIVAALVP